MKQLTKASWLRAIIITCLSNTTSSSLLKSSEQFHKSLEYFVSGRFTAADLN